MTVDWLRKRSFQAPRANYMRSSGMVTWNQHAHILIYIYIYIYTQKFNYHSYTAVADADRSQRNGVEGRMIQWNPNWNWRNSNDDWRPTAYCSNQWLLISCQPLHHINCCISYILKTRQKSLDLWDDIRIHTVFTYPPFLQVQSQQDAAQLDESKALGGTILITDRKCFHPCSSWKMIRKSCLMFKATERVASSPFS